MVVPCPEKPAATTDQLSGRSPLESTGRSLYLQIALLPVIALACWPRLPLDAYDAPKLGLAALLLALLPWRWRPVPRALCWLLAAILSSLLLTGLIAPHQSGYWFGSAQNGQGVLALLLCLCAVAWAWGSAASSSVPRWLDGAAPAVLLVSMLVLLQWIGLDLLQTSAPRPPGSFGHALALAQWLILLLPWCGWQAWRATGVRRYGYGVALVLGFLALLASGSRGAILALLLVVLCMLALRQRRPLVGLLACGVIAVVLSVALVQIRPQSLSHRWLLWESAAEVVQQPPVQLWPDGRADPSRSLRPWLGYGADLQALPMRAVTAPDARFSSDPDRAHNVLLDLCLRYGALGLLVWCSVAFWVWRNWGQARPAANWQWPLRLGLLAWLLSLLSGFAATADSLTAALLLGATLRSTGPHVGGLWRPAWWFRFVGRSLLLLAAVLIWLSPPGILATAQGAGWRAPERALLAFSQATTYLLAARDQANAALACAEGAAALQLLERATQLDPTRGEYLLAARQTRQAWCTRCDRERASCDN